MTSSPPEHPVTMDAAVAALVPLATVALLLLSLAFGIRMLGCLFSEGSRQRVRRRWRTHFTWGALSVGFLGFVVVSAVRAPQEYAERARIQEGFSIAESTKMAIAERWHRTGTLAGSNEEAGIAAPNELNGRFLESITVAQGGAIVLRYKDAPAVPDNARGRTVVFTPTPGRDGLTWDCSGGDVPERLRPTPCRGG